MKSKIQKTLSIPKTILLKKIVKLPFKPLIKIFIQKKEYEIIQNYLKFNCNLNPDYFDSNFDIFHTNDTKLNLTEVENIINHKFNLLGSGLIKVAYDSRYNGFLGKNFSNPVENYARRIDLLPAEHKEFSQKVISHISDRYEPIDWFVDFRSGFRWKCDYHNKIKYGNLEGVDIKVPWELARLHHIFDLSLVYGIVDNTLKKDILKEIANQILDFISMNPPFYGPNWVSPMEVSIRSVNITFALLELRKNGGVLPDIILSNIYNYLYASFLFIKLHPEWNDGLRNNHYLANLLGLSVLSRFLFGNTAMKFQSKLFKKFKNELSVQFFDDGGNFEGSIPYHFFSFEIVYWLLQNYLKHIKNDQVVKNKLFKIIDFNSMFSKIDPENIQIGDNDSGKIFNIRCLYHFNYNFYNLSNNIIKTLNYNINNNFIYKTFDNFGLVYFKENEFDLFISLGRKAQLGKGGHNHNDSQSFILVCNDIPIIVDPGTFVYTSSPKYRNLFRSSIYHNKIIDLSNNEFEDNLSSLFWFYDRKLRYLFKLHNNKKIFEFIDKKPHFKRKYVIDNNKLIIIDLIKNIKNTSKYKALFHLHPECTINAISANELLITNNKIEILFSSSQILNVETYLYSPNYGEVLNSNKISAEINNSSNFEVTFIINQKK